MLERKRVARVEETGIDVALMITAIYVMGSVTTYRYCENPHRFTALDGDV
jgi:hypothetical protein